jgi:hypothetical protein
VWIPDRVRDDGKDSTGARISVKNSISGQARDDGKDNKRYTTVVINPLKNSRPGIEEAKRPKYPERLDFSKLCFSDNQRDVVPDVAVIPDSI